MHKFELRNYFLLIFVSFIFFSDIATASEQTYVREYTYLANALDTKISARAIALQEVKRTLLNELGTHVSSHVRISRSSNGTQLATEEIQTLSAGVTKVSILNEKWDGHEYVLKAQIKADPEEVLKSLYEMLEADNKQKKTSQLKGELSRIRTENFNISESLILLKRKTAVALAEIVRLRNQLGNKKTESDLQELKVTYQQQVDTLTLNEWHEMAMRYYLKDDYSNAFRLFKKIAEQGNAAAQANIGWMYSNGEGVARNVKKGVYWYHEAAEQGDAYAQTILGAMYIEGKVTIHNPAKAMYWFNKAAGQGRDIAQLNIGVLYDDGIGVARDVKQAAYWYQKAAEQGNVDAQINIGVMYASGIAVTYDAKQAAYWYQKAAEQGNVDAQTLLGIMYAKGAGITRDSKQAAYWYQKAAVKGGVNAQKNLAMMYAKGDGVILDPKQAMYWIQKAADQGDTDAQAILQRLR